MKELNHSASNTEIKGACQQYQLIIITQSIINKLKI